MKNLFLAAIAFGLVSGCSSPQVQRPLSDIEVAKEASKKGRIASSQLEPHFVFYRNTDVTNYFVELTLKLSKGLTVFEAGEVEVNIYQGKDTKNYSLPGSNIYLSLRELKRVDYEAEVAALLAIELGHIFKRHALLKWEKYDVNSKLEAEHFFGKGGVFDYSENEKWEAIETAMSLLYQAGFDPRGMLEYLNKREKKYVPQVRQWIANQAPVRNPIVRSEKFIRIQEKIRRL